MPPSPPPAPPPALPPARTSLIVWLGVTQIVSWGSIYYLFALLIVPLERELACSRSAIAGAFSLSLLISGLSAPWIGRWIDRVGGRGVMTLGALCNALLLAALSQVHSLLALYLVWGALGVAMAATLYEAAFAVVTWAFPQQYRRAITTLTLFGGFASTVFWPLTAWLIEQLGWRDATLCLAAINLLMCVPIHFFCVPDVHPLRVANAPTSAPFRDWWRRPAFAAFALSFVGQSLVMSAVGVHLLALLTERGLSTTEAAAVGAMIGPMQVLGRVLELTFSARLSAVQVGRWAVLLLPVSLGLLLVAGVQWWWLAMFALLYGAGNGAMTIVRGAAPVELFGREQYGAMSGALAAPALAAKAAGPVIAALVWSVSAAWGGAMSGYAALLLLLTGVSILAALAYFRAVRSAV